jgi:WD40 repeat protein
MNPTAAANEGKAKLMLFRIRDEEKDVLGDIFPPDPPNKKLVPDLKKVHEIDTDAAVVAVQWSPHDPEILLATLANGSIIVVNVRMGRKPRMEILSTHFLPSVKGHVALSICFSPRDDDHVAFTYTDGSVVIASVDDDSIEELQAFKPHGDKPMLSCGYSSDGKKLYVSDSAGMISSWFVRRKAGLKLEWVEGDIHDDTDGVPTLVVWPPHDGANLKKARRLLLTGALDGKMRVLDLGDDQVPPPMKQELDMFYITDDKPDGGIWKLDALPALPRIKDLEKMDVGVFSSYESPDIECDYNEVGIVVSGLEGGCRIMVQRPEFSDVHLPELDEEGKPIFKEEEKSTTADGVEKDWYGREKRMEWYNVIEFSENEGKSFASSATAFVDWDSIFKEEGKQNKRRGWRVVTTSFEDRKLAIFHIYVD